MAIGGRGARGSPRAGQRQRAQGGGRFVLHPAHAGVPAPLPSKGGRAWLRLEDRYMGSIDDQVDLARALPIAPSPGLIGRQLMRIDHLRPRRTTWRSTARQHPHDLAAHSCIYLGETPSDAQWKFPPQRQNR
ncbi:hypothetical protein M8494_05435 [Serratia ureilytica]